MMCACADKQDDTVARGYEDNENVWFYFGSLLVCLWKWLDKDVLYNATLKKQTFIMTNVQIKWRNPKSVSLYIKAYTFYHFYLSVARQ